jgi:hypothetical protein
MNEICKWFNLMDRRMCLHSEDNEELLPSKSPLGHFVSAWQGGSPEAGGGDGEGQNTGAVVWTVLIVSNGR